MKRLTEKDYCGYDIKDRQNFNGYDDDKDCQKIFSCLQKLGKHEDIEEELGIDIIVLFKARKGICYKNGLGTIYSINPLEPYNFDIDLFNECIYVEYYNKPYRNLSLAFSDYGKTWALTKEELENESSK